VRRVSETVASDETGNSKSGSSLEVLKQLVNHEPDRHPLVIALVAPLGTRTDTLLDQLRDTLRSFKYDLNLVTLSELLDEIPCAPWEQLPARDHAGYYESRMGAGDTLRERTGSGATLAGLAIGKIADHRRSDEAQPATAYVLRSLKHPDEAELLKHIYGDAFWLLALVSDADERREDFAEQLSAAGATFDDRRLEADVLIARDENDESAANGQHVGSVFKRADYYLPIRRGFDCRDDVERFLNGVFGKPFMTPFELEEAMRLSFAASLRSASAGRQVGATLIPVAGSVYVTGTNEVPKPGGGQYWAGDEPDHRDFQSGYDPNPLWTSRMLQEFFDRLSDSDWLRDDLRGQSGSELLQRARQPEGNKRALLSGTRAESIIEFTRCLHAEQAAILNAAMQGISTRRSVLVTTTFPCHECAKFIVGAGVRAVVYVEPYPKSLVRQLYRDLIDAKAPMPSNTDLQALGTVDTTKVPFIPFVGFAPHRYDEVFRAGERKQGARVAEFDRAKACPRSEGWSEAAIGTRETKAATAAMRLVAETFTAEASPTSERTTVAAAPNSRAQPRRKKADLEAARIKTLPLAEGESTA